MPAELLKKLYLDWAAAFERNPDLTLEEWRDIVEHWGDATAEPGGVDYVEVNAGGVPAMWATPKNGSADRAILAIHGGGFATGSVYTHRKLFGHFAKAIGCEVLITGYRHSPEHVHPAQVEDTFSAYTWLLDQGINPRHIALTGDSSGGGLTITTLLCARDRGLPMPAAAMPFSPWVDLEATGESMLSNSETDALLSKEFVHQLANMFLGENGNPRDPLANPLYADLTGLPPIYIQVGGHEVNLDDARQLAAHAEKAGLEVRLDIFPGQQHTFQMAAGRAPEADEAIRQLAEWVRPKLGLPLSENYG